MTSSEKPEPQGSEPSSTDLCACGHGEPSHRHAPRCIGNRNLCTCLVYRPGEAPKPCTCGPNEACGDPCTPVCPPACIEGHTYSGSCMLRALGPGEPPLTPEEEEEAPEDCVCGNPSDSDARHRTDGPCSMKELPPQPERRAPYVATYSVGGHLYEVAVPGDACLQAVDGALVIRHGLGPVAGLVGFQPLTVEEKPSV